MDVARALTIAGSDSGGGAGIQADLKTFLALGVHGMSAIAALTAQNTKSVSSIHEVPADFVYEQIKQVTLDIGIDAAKTGMLFSAGIIEAVSQAIVDFGINDVVVDPVFVSKNGDQLLSPDATDVLRTKLFPLAACVTPNLYEAGRLVGRDLLTEDDMRRAAREIHGWGPGAVLVKGGHLVGAASDIMYDGNDFVLLESPRIDSPHTHGTGCVLSAAITAYLARGYRLADAVSSAKVFVTGAIRSGLAVGAGHGPVNPGWNSTLKA